MLPIWKSIEIHTQLPKPKDYPYYVKNIGDAIKKKRLDLKLTKVELAKILNISPATIKTWENQSKRPVPRMMKCIINWLEHIPPLGVNDDNLSGQLYIYRMMHGKTQTEIARELSIDNNVIAKIERRGKVNSIYIEKIDKLIN